MEWPKGDEWRLEIKDPFEKIADFHRLIASIHLRWEKAGNIGAGSYWSEPPRALAGVEHYAGCLNACARRIEERVN